MMKPFNFETAVVGRRIDGDLVIALMCSLEPPLDKVKTCVALVSCSQTAASALCATIARTR